LLAPGRAAAPTQATRLFNPVRTVLVGAASQPSASKLAHYRLNTAKNPTTGIIETHRTGPYIGKPKYPPAATRFLGHWDQLNAIYRAQLIFRRNGRATSLEPMDMGKIIGEGYSRDGTRYSQQRKARVILDANGKPKTAYTEQ